MSALRKYGAVARMTALAAFMYRGDLLIRCSSMGMILFVFVQLWTATYELGGFTTIAGFTLPAMLWYLVVTETATHTADATNLVQRIGEEVKSGDITRVLVRPYSYVGYQFGVYCGELTLRLPATALVAALVVWLAVGGPPTNLQGLLLGCLSTFVSLGVIFLVCIGIGLLAFWFEEPLPFWWVFQKLLFTVGGMFMPLELLPRWLADIAIVLPFASVAYAPGRIFLGQVGDGIWSVLGLQLLWAGILWLAVSALYERGLRKLAIQGG
jgi:ABC-2 type transport system permease protein